MTTPAALPASANAPLPAAIAALATRASEALARGRPDEAVAPLDEALSLLPGHPQLLRLCGLLEYARGHVGNAIGLLEQAQRLQPQDAATLNDLGSALARAGRLDEAIAMFRHAATLQPQRLDARINLGRALDQHGDAAAALRAFDEALAIDPHHLAVRVLRADSLKTLGRIAEAQAALRAVVSDDADCAPAWIALANIGALRGDRAGLAKIARLHAKPNNAPAQRIELAFAYASVLESAALFAHAHAVFVEANAAKRRSVSWNAEAVSALIDAILAAFASAPIEASSSSRGSAMIFLVGMPRSGSTLAEQILAAHPEVAGGGEREEIAALLQVESRRRGARFPDWVGAAADADWARLGDEYLARTARWRADRTRLTDKTLANWQTVGAIRRMLPGARIVHCVRDPLETCWSCYKHHFGEAQFFTYAVDELAAFFHDSQRAMRVWNERHPGVIHVHRHEDLLDDPERSVRSLLAHCGLSFDPACLRSHEVEREVHTASSVQVRLPLQRTMPLAERYGELLDPLRRALATAASGSVTEDSARGS